jgi:hypothetical protein
MNIKKKRSNVLLDSGVSSAILMLGSKYPRKSPSLSKSAWRDINK